MHYGRNLGNPCTEKCPRIGNKNILINFSRVKEKTMQEYVMHGYMSVITDLMPQVQKKKLCS